MINGYISHIGAINSETFGSFYGSDWLDKCLNDFGVWKCGGRVIE